MRRKILLGLVFSLISAAVWGAIAIGVIVAWAYFFEPYRITVEPVGIEVKGRRGGPGGEIRIAFFSDLDLKGLPGRREAKVLDAVRELAPDVVAVGGDLFGGDGSDPGEEAVRRMCEWLGEVARAAEHGAVVVWGEQEVDFAAHIVPLLPPEVVALEHEQIVLPAGDTRVRLCGPEGHLATMDVEDGTLRSAGGATGTVAWYAAEEAAAWESIELTARLLYGNPGNGPGLAVLVGEGRPGVWLRISPTSARWQWERTRPDWDGRWGSRQSLPSNRWLRARVRVEVDDEVTRIFSRAWVDGRTEPERWDVTMERRDGDRPRRGSVGVVAGAPSPGAGRHEWDDLEVRDLSGALLWREGFEDPEVFRGAWRNPGGRPDDFDATVMVAHSPLQQVGIGRHNLDVVLAGHTHGGQVRLPIFGPAGTDPNIPVGWIMGKTFRYDVRRWLYVGRGIGTSGHPLRLFCPPEITDLTVRVVPRPAS